MSPTWLVERYRWRALIINIAGTSTPVRSWPGRSRPSIRPRHGARLRRCSSAAAAAVTMALNFLIAPPLFAMLDGDVAARGPARDAGAGRRPSRINIAVVASIAEIYAELGARRARLRPAQRRRLHVHDAARRHRARTHARVREPLVGRALRPDPHARRARLARGAPLRGGRRASRATSPSRSACPSATRSSRTPRGCCTTSASSRSPIGSWSAAASSQDSDWRGIRRHPDIGAELLRDIGVYGPVAEIVRAHHERMDGRGYPRGLAATRSRRSRGSWRWPRSTTRSPRPTPTARR